jgi:hypothetical protein
LTIPRLVAIGFIFCATAVAWSTLGAVLTLFVMMQVTGRVDWDDLLGGRVTLRDGKVR